MIPVCLCENDPEIRAHLMREIEDYLLIENLDMQIVCAAGDPGAVLDQCRSQDAGGIYFLDIDLGIPGMNGFELAKTIREIDARGVIVFVTTHGELSMETFRYRLEAMDYILKDDADEMRRRIRECLNTVQQRILRQAAETSEYYTVKVFDTIYNIPVSRILYFETASVKHRIRLHAEGEIIEFPGKLQKIAEELGDGFFRCHRSILVNRDQIRAIHLKDHMIELTDGSRCPLSRKARATLE